MHADSFAICDKERVTRKNGLEYEAEWSCGHHTYAAYSQQQSRCVLQVAGEIFSELLRETNTCRFACSSISFIPLCPQWT